MQPLSKALAMQCENAAHPRCACRCGGSAHGKARITDRERFDELPLEDPHHRPPITTKVAAARKLRRIMVRALHDALQFNDILDGRRLVEDVMACAAIATGQIRRK